MGEVLPVLDGLDEVPAAQRPAAVAALETWLRDTGPLVVGGTAESLRGPAHDGDTPPAVRSASVPGPGAPRLAEPRLAEPRLAELPLVEVRPVEPRLVAEYVAPGNGPGASDVRAVVADVLTSSAGSAAAEALREPLVVDLLHTVQRARSAPRCDAGRRDGRDDGETVRWALDLAPRDRAGAPDAPDSADAVRARLARLYLRVVVGSAGDRLDQDRTAAGDAERHLRALAFLADRMAAERVTGLGWWDLHRAMPRPLQTLPWLVGGICVGIGFGTQLGLTLGIVFGLLAGLVFEWRRRRDSTRPDSRVPRHVPLRRPRPRFERTAKAAGRPANGERGAAGQDDDPRWSMRQCRGYALYLAAPLIAAVQASYEGYLYVLLHVAPSSLAVAAVAEGVAVVAFTLGCPWGQFVIARHWLAWRRGLPRDILGFLDDACERGVLLRVGAVWEFRHPAVAAVLVASDHWDGEGEGYRRRER